MCMPSGISLLQFIECRGILNMTYRIYSFYKIRYFCPEKLFRFCLSKMGVVSLVFAQKFKLGFLNLPGSLVKISNVRKL